MTSAEWMKKLLGVGLAAVVATGCGAPEAVVDSDDAVGSERRDIVDVNQTPSKYQSIGNCWLYATASWAESLHLTASGEQVNLSESYWTYWNWFDSIISGRATMSLSTGGTFQTASSIIRRYGWMTESDFIPEEANAEKSNRQALALALINQSLSSGVLKDPTARRDRATVRLELDRAWGLSANVVAVLDQVFAANVTRTFPDAAAVSAATGTSLRTSSQLSVQYLASPTATADTSTTLAQALTDWTELYTPTPGTAAHRSWEKRVQRAMHGRLPVLITWFVDFNALNNRGQFADVPVTPGRQGFHMTVLEDYEVENVPGFGTLPAGTLENNPEALNAALSDEAQLTFFRTKNSWGTFRPDRPFVEGFPGHHDLNMKYLNGPVKQCLEKNGATDTTNCPWSIAPLMSGIMPRGF
ncbi:MAG: hypothetical protein ACT4TC_12080 [Myxococcaceae bacterium]